MLRAGTGHSTAVAGWAKSSGKGPDGQVTVRKAIGTTASQLPTLARVRSEWATEGELQLLTYISRAALFSLYTQQHHTLTVPDCVSLQGHKGATFHPKVSVFEMSGTRPHVSLVAAEGAPST